eukprot:1091604-Rhodomonas_salina.3
MSTNSSTIAGSWYRNISTIAGPWYTNIGTIAGLWYRIIPGACRSWYNRWETQGALRDQGQSITVMFRNKPPTRVVQNTSNRGGGAYLGTSR